MSWFDASSLSSFAKTALSQAQNLQKSIDRVLDIEDDSSDAASRSSASSKEEPALSSVSSDSTNKTSSTGKSSSLLSTSAASTSSRKSSSDVFNSKHNDSAEGNSFWSSFLGDSFSSTTNSYSKTSSHRSSGRKPGPRTSGTVSGKNVRSSSDGRKNAQNVNTTADKDRTLFITAFKEEKSDGIDVAKMLKSQSNLFSNTHLSKKETGIVSTDGPCDTTQTVASDISGGEDNLQKVNCDAQDSRATPVLSNHGLDLKHSENLMCSAEESRRENSEEPNINIATNDNALVNISVEASSKDVGEEKSVATSTSEELLFVMKGQNQIPESHTVESSTVEKYTESQNTSKNTLERTNNAGSVIKSESNKDDAHSAIDSSANVGNSRSCGADFEVVVHVGVTTGDTLQEPSTELANQHRLQKVVPLASSTPNCHFNKQFDDNAKTEEMHLQGAGDFHEDFSQIAGLVDSIPFTGMIKENDSLAVNEQEVMVEAVSVKQQKHSKDIITQENTEEVLAESEKQHPSMINVITIMPLETEERKYDLVENSTENMDNLKTKMKELQNEVINLQHVLEVRENKLVVLSKENVDLQETANILRSQLEQAESALNADDEEIEEVRQEFIVRVAATEKKFQAAAKERDKLKALLEEREKSLNSRNERQLEEFTTLVKEKDDQIAQLLEEGEKLSKQELQINNTIRKLRAKEKENEAVIKKNSKALEDLTSENTRLNEILQVKEGNERKQADGITKLNTYVEKQEEKIAKRNSELDDANEKLRSMQTALDNAYKQLADLHKENASKDSAVQEAALSAEMNVKEGLRIAMEKKERQYKKEIETLEFQISDLQTSLRRNEQQANRREDTLRQEITDIQQRLQEAEARNQELTESVTHATRPLLRQIENLQSSYGNHTQTWERVERNLTERLNEAQIQLTEAQEKERVATEHALELNSRLTAVESQLVTYRQGKSRLEATLEVERAKLDTTEDARSREAARAEALNIKYRKMMEDNNVEKALLEQQLAVEKSKMETEKKRFQSALDEKERILLRQSGFSGVPSSPSAGSWPPQDEHNEAPPHMTLVRQSSNSSVIDGISRGIMAGSTAMVERLQAQVKQKDGETELLQEEIFSLQKTRDSLTEELTHLTSRMENLERNTGLLVDLQARHKELEQRHNAVLQMYGEKAEQCEELRMDLEDVTSMYKSQIQELLGASR